MHTTLRAARVLSLLSLLASCAQPPARPREAPRSAAPPVPAAPVAEHTLVGRTLIYPVRHGRAEDLAAVLLPVLDRRFGPGVRIVPQVGSNRLLIQLPTPRERELVQSSRPGAAGRRGMSLPSDGRK